MSIRLLNGDCLEVMKTLPDASLDLIVCDLPYGCLHAERKEPEAQKKYNGHAGAQGCAWDVKIDLTKFWAQAKRLLKNKHCPVIHFCTTKFGYELIKSNESWFRYDLVWDKKRGVSFLQANKMPMRSHEMMYVFSEAGAEYKRVDISGNFKAFISGKGISRQYGGVKKIQKENDGTTRCVLSVVPVADEEPEHEMLYVFSEQGAAYKRVDISGNFKSWKLKETPGDRAPNKSGGKLSKNIQKENDGSTRCALSIIDVKAAPARGKHPTEKPMDLYKWLLERYLPAGGTVLDPTFGSGNCLFQAQAMGGHAIGIEKDKGFFDKAVERLNAQTPPQNVIEEKPTPEVNEVAGGIEGVEQGQSKVEHTQKRNRGVHASKGADGKGGPKSSPNP